MESTWKLRHVGIPVRNLDKGRNDYLSSGLTTFHREFVMDSSKFTEYLVYGKTPDPVVKTRVAMGQAGPLQVELLQPLQGEPVQCVILPDPPEE